jgi:hypothetical protein
MSVFFPDIGGPTISALRTRSVPIFQPTGMSDVVDGQLSEELESIAEQTVETVASDGEA